MLDDMSSVYFCSANPSMKEEEYKFPNSILDGLETPSNQTMTTTMNFTPFGIDTGILTNLKAIDQLPKSIAIQIDEILDNLHRLDTNLDEVVLNTHRRRIFRTLFETAFTYRPQNFQEYIWFAKFSIALLLVKDCPNSLLDTRIRMIAHAFSDNGVKWHTDNRKIHRVAKEIYCLTSNATNIAFVILNISTYSEFTLYVAISLAWATFRSLDGESPILFRMYEFQNVIPLIHKILFLTDADQQSDKVHNFLTLYSVYQKLVLADSKINAELLNYDYLRYTENDAIEIHDKFTKGRARLQKVMHQQNTPEDCILMLELMRYDILEPLQKLVPVYNLYPI